jgi:hypothetical protein
MKVRLTRKLADRIDGIDLQGREPGDVLELPTPEARLLLAEAWAIPERRREATDHYPKPDRRFPTEERKFAS